MNEYVRDLYDNITVRLLRQTWIGQKAARHHSTSTW